VVGDSYWVQETGRSGWSETVTGYRRLDVAGGWRQLLGTGDWT
jgi:hypothetical protein